MEHKSEGICRFCLKKYSGAGIGRHLAACKTRKDQNALEIKKERKKYKIYHLKIFDYKWYWLHIEIPASATLGDLDDFLRGIWLECCGHMSEFTIGGVRYEDRRLSEGHTYLDNSTESMNKRLYSVLKVRDAFSYEYDFGSTTYLQGQVLAVREGNLGKNKIHILARNNPYVFACDHCGKPAAGTCCECEEFVCDQCLESHECGEEMVLEVVNSPRMGVCGYGGPDLIDDWTPK